MTLKVRFKNMHTGIDTGIYFQIMRSLTVRSKLKKSRRGGGGGGTATQDAVPSFLLSDSENSSFLGQKWSRPTWLSGGHLGSSFVQNYDHISAPSSPRLESHPSVPYLPTVE